MRLVPALPPLLAACGAAAAPPAAVISASAAPDPEFPLAFDVAVGLDRAPATVTVTCAARDSRGAATATSAELNTTNGSVRVMRLAPGREYVLSVSAGGAARTVSAVSGKTGIAELDDAPLVTVSGAPTWDVVVTDRRINDSMGLVAFDRTGWVVWYSAASGPSWDQLPNHDIVSLEFTGKPPLMPPMSGGIIETTPTGAVVQSLHPELDTACDVYSGGELTHEAHVDSSDPSLVVTVQKIAKDVDGLTLPQSGDQLVLWNRETNAIRKVGSLFDVFDPVKDRGALSNSSSSSPFSKIVCPGAQQRVAVEDWSHCNAACRGTAGNYLLNSRHLSAVVSFAAGEGEGVQWTLSSEVSSSLTFDKPTSRFYNQHCVRQRPDGNIILWDNGDSRPEAEGGPFSRGAEYALDPGAGTATLVWEFRPMLNATHRLYSRHNGGMAALRNGNRVMSSCCDNPLAGDGCTMQVFEADKAGAQVSHAFVPGESPQDGLGFRALPIDSIGGERTINI